MADDARLMRIRDDLAAAMRSGEVQPKGAELYQLASDLVTAAHPEAPRPRKVDPFSLLVGFACGAAVQKVEGGEAG